MRRPPRDPRAGLLARAAVARSVVTGLLLTAGALALFRTQLPSGEEHARAVALAALLCGDLILVFAERALSGRAASAGVPRTVSFWGIWAAAALTIPVALYVGPVARALRVTPMDGRDWLLALGVAVATVGWRAFAGRR